jgi:acetate kinase
MFYYRTAQLFCEMAQAMHGVRYDGLFGGYWREFLGHALLAFAHELEWMGVKIDEEKNAVRSGEVRDISAPDSRVSVLIVPTNEEYMIALDVKELLG